MKNRLIALIFLALASACAQQGQETSAKLEVTIGAIGINSFTGGYVITGKNTTGDKFVKVMDVDNAVNLSLKNGQWSFLAMYWEGATLFTGKIRCAAVDATLNGGEVPIKLTLNNDNCFNGLIGNTANSSGSAGNYEPKHILPRACRGDVSARGTSACSLTFTVGDPDAVVGFMPSFKVVLGQGEANAKTSSCHDNLGSVTALPKIPLVDAKYQSPFTIKAYPAVACNDSAGHVLRHLQDPKAKVLDVSGSAWNIAHLRISEDDICALADISSPTTVDYFGAGTAESPHLICHLAQLKHLQQNFTGGTGTAYNLRKYVLGRVLDLLPGIRMGSSNAQAYSTCAFFEDGSTFIPMGLMESSCTLVGSGDFSGEFHGLGHSVKNFRFKSNQSGLNNGFFRTIASSAKLAHLTLQNFSAEGGLNLGGIAGAANTSALIHDLEVIDGEVRDGSVATGGVIGQASTNVENLFARKMLVRAQASPAGGILGMTSANITKASFDGIVDSFATTSGTGGIVGSTTAGVFDQVTSSGFITGNSYVGGIVGNSTSTATHNYWRSTAIIHPRDQVANIYAGGLLGGHSGTLTLYYSAFLGKVVFKCTNGTPALCLIGAIAGNHLTLNNVAASETHSGYGGREANALNTLATDAFPTLIPAICPGTGCLWTRNGDDYPRLAFEKDECSIAANQGTLASQISAGKGSAANPIVLCSRFQLDQINANSSLHYRMGASFTVHTSARLATNFFGSFDGNHNVLGGGVWPTGGLSIFGTIEPNAIFKNTVVAGFHYTDTAAASVAPLALTNKGEIERVKAQGNVVRGANSIAGLVMTNFTGGIIIDSSVDADLVAYNDIGGIVASNNGTIERSGSHVKISMPPNTMSTNKNNFAGIALANTGTIQQSVFDGSIDLVYGVTWNSTIIPSYVGGLVAVNNGGTIEDSHVSRKAEIELPTLSNFVGGLVGDDLTAVGSITRNLFAGKLIHADATLPAQVAALVGSSGGSISTSNFHESPVLQASPVLAISGSYSYSSPNCTVTMPTTTSSAPYAVFLGEEMGWRAYVGTGSSVSVAFAIDSVLASQCSGTVTGANAWLSTPTVSNIGSYPSTLDSPFGNVHDMHSSSVGEADVVYDAYHELLSGITPTTIPVWTYEDGEVRPFLPYDDH